MNGGAVLLCAAAGLACGAACVGVLNAVPSKWLCDYGEEPPASLYGVRARLSREGAAAGLCLVPAFALLWMQAGGRTVPFFSACTAAALLVLTALADGKYRIIPDQFVLLLLLPGAAGVFSGTTGWLPALLGALSGALLWVLLGLAGALFYRRETVGAGDVKLFAAVGLLVGFPEVCLVFLMTILLAGVHFSFLLLRKRIGGGAFLPMGPYICTACLLFLSFERQANAAAELYFSLFS